MDYAIVQAIGYITIVSYILLLYDVICQFWVNFLTRIAQCHQLPTLPPNLSIIPGIGLFHVHGHKKECYPRYAPSFIPGAGMIDGEILETLWSPLNHTASSARSMTWYSRQEYLDAHMADSNLKKLIGTGRSTRIRLHIYRSIRNRQFIQSNANGRYLSIKLLRALSALTTFVTHFPMRQSWNGRRMKHSCKNRGVSMSQSWMTMMFERNDVCFFLLILLR